MMRSNILFFLIFFIGANVLSTFGIEKHILDYTVIILALINIFLDKNIKTLFFTRRKEILIITLILILIIYRSYSGILTDSIRSAMVLLATPIIYMNLSKNIENKKDFSLKKNLIKIIILFYIFECFLGIFEYIIKSHVFLWVDSTFESHLFQIQSGSSFRSVALHGSPLTNALIVTILNSFIIDSPLKDKYKFFLWAIGFAAVMAFNARMAVIINVFILVIYLAKLLLNNKISLSTKFLINISVIIFIIFTSYLVFYQGLGDRLFKTELLDESSAQKRIDLFSIFDEYEISNFMFGTSMENFENIRDSVGLLIIENFWVCELILFGIVFVILFTILYGRLILDYMRQFPWIERWKVTLIFILLASTNNSLFTQYLPLLVFLICMNLFRKNTFRIIVPSKYINKNLYTQKRK